MTQRQQSLEKENHKKRNTILIASIQLNYP